jgi:hypothetical protein
MDLRLADCKMFLYLLVCIATLTTGIAVVPTVACSCYDNSVCSGGGVCVDNGGIVFCVTGPLFPDDVKAKELPYSDQYVSSEEGCGILVRFSFDQCVQYEGQRCGNSKAIRDSVRCPGTP